ncbi:MAG: hypothetical protein P4L55_22705 [Syntrophobacteraceae bacterium]|nr:hypothetical protein [Syntrophobacteraceae bacterium]
MGTVILYANTITDSMPRAFQETDRRRTKQIQHNTANNIVPKSVEKEISDILVDYRMKPRDSEFIFEPRAEFDSEGAVSPDQRILALEKEMKEAAALRDEIKRLREKQLMPQ